MYFKITIFFLITIFTCTIGQAQVKPARQIIEDAKSKIVQISANELKMKIESEDTLILVDVRTEKEYLCGHVGGAVWIPRGKIEFGIQRITKDPNAEIIIYCRAGSRNALSVCTLNNIGYKNVLNLDGGFRNWVNEGKSVFNMHGEIKIINFEKEEKGVLR